MASTIYSRQRSLGVPELLQVRSSEFAAGTAASRRHYTLLFKTLQNILST